MLSWCVEEEQMNRTVTAGPSILSGLLCLAKTPAEKATAEASPHKRSCQCFVSAGGLTPALQPTPVHSFTYMTHLSAPVLLL